MKTLRAALLAALLGTGGICAADEMARIHYLLHCGGCHLPDGRGVPPEVPSLHGELGRLAGIPEGRRYLARVPGASQTPLSDSELASVLNWVLTAFNQGTLPEAFAPLSPEEVGQARAEVLADPARERERIWARYDLEGR